MVIKPSITEVQRRGEFFLIRYPNAGIKKLDEGRIRPLQKTSKGAYTVNQNISNQIQQCEQILNQLMNQTQQASQNYQQLLQQEQQNAAQLDALAQRERQAVQVIQNALHGHQLAMQQMQQATQICKQLEQIQQSQSQLSYGAINQSNQSSYSQQRYQ